MPIDPAMRIALHNAVAEAAQAASVGDRLEAWLEGLSNGDDSGDVQKRNYDGVFAKLQAEPTGED